ncbi:hypothetical protein LCGC14_1238940 [marine sediment metagenome]|uniref:Uncharacterized protein n=1 Tax=marine sediment metagenome TaxID=412755 RepID=A0A0F9NNK3_9ZZZZ
MVKCPNCNSDDVGIIFKFEDDDELFIFVKAIRMLNINVFDTEELKGKANKMLNDVEDFYEQHKRGYLNNDDT